MEYYRRAQQDTTPVSASFLWAGIIRLALHMGYHRDPRHFEDITPFEGEMRRRAWALLVECDTIVSFLFGLPISIPRRFTDTKLPGNTWTRTSTKTCPPRLPPRPDSQMTRVLYPDHDVSDHVGVCRHSGRRDGPVRVPVRAHHGARYGPDRKRQQDTGRHAVETAHAGRHWTPSG